MCFRYHDIHHQLAGIKNNFSQPFFTFWDTVLGTKWTGGDLKNKRTPATPAESKPKNHIDVAKSSNVAITSPKASPNEDANADKRVQTQKLRNGSARKRTKGSGLKGLADRMGDSLHGKGTGVLGVENRSR
jgi:sphinganine C4-monooxygenase